MNPMITEQLDKFKTGDFSGYESFYNETVQTVYTMLHTIVNDQDVATSLVPQVYDKIYRNVADLEQTEGFYQWAAGYANEEALCYLKTENLTGTISADPASDIKDQTYDGKAPTESLSHSPESGPGATESFYDYALEDAELTITEDLVSDNFFVSKLQEIVNTLSPIERVVFQDYYYFGTSVPEIAVKTGCKDTDIRYTLNRTRTEILQVITEASATASGNPNHADTKRYHLSDAPWMWIAYQNFLGYTLGIDMVSIAGWSLGVLGQAVGTGMTAGSVAGANGAAGIAGSTAGMSVNGAAGIISGAEAGSASAAGAAAAGSAAAAGGASGLGGFAAALIGTIGGKIAAGVIGAALVTSIGFGVHHVVANQDREGARQNTAPSVTEVAEATEETTVSTTESKATTEATTQATTETTTGANGDAEDEGIGIGASKIDHEKEAKRAYKEFLQTVLSTNNYTWTDGKTFVKTTYDNFAFFDIDGDSVPELLVNREGTCEADRNMLVYGYNTQSKSVIPYYTVTNGSVFYKNGYVIGSGYKAADNFATFLPIYIWKCENGQLNECYDINAWDRNQCIDNSTGEPTEYYYTYHNGAPFPEDIDKDGDGFVYVVNDQFMDTADYNAFIAGFGSAIFDGPYQDMTTDNVNAIN